MACGLPILSASNKIKDLVSKFGCGLKLKISKDIENAILKI